MDLYCGQADNSKLREIFPEEIWFQLLSILQDAEAYCQICAASPFFASRLWPLRPKILFHSASKILINRLTLTTTTDILDIFLKCREVCKEWKRDVDTILHNSELHKLQFNHEIQHNYFVNPEPLEYQDKFHDGHHILGFMDHFRGTHSGTQTNPLVYRSIRIFVSDADPLVFLERLFEMLVEYGHHVWFLNVYIQVPDPQVHLQVYTKLAQVLEQVPNLRRLNLVYGVNITGAEYIALLQDHVKRNPLPSLRGLKSLDCLCVPQPIWKDLWQRNARTVCELRLASQYFSNPRDMSNLSTLFISLTSEEHLQLFEQEAPTACRLKKLRLYLFAVPYTQGLIHRVFCLLENNFSTTLLELALTPSSGIHDGFPDSLFLPKLQHFHMQLHNWTSLDFILPMAKTLEYVSVDFSFDHEDMLSLPDHDADNVIRIYNFRGALHMSNIWTVLPKLQFLRCMWPLVLPWDPVKLTECRTRDEWKVSGKNCFMGHFPLSKY